MRRLAAPRGPTARAAARRALGITLGAALCTALGAAPAAAQVVPPGLVPPSPAPGGFVHDGGPVLSAAERAAANAHVAAVRRATGGDVAVLILRDLGGRAPVDVAVAAYRAWGVGRVDVLGSARRDLGALLLLVPKELAPDGRGRCWVATGLGAEGPLTDAAAGAICREAVVPELRARRYAAAVDSGVSRIGAAFARATAGLPAPEVVGAAPMPVVTPAEAEGGAGVGVLVLALTVAVGGGIGAFVFAAHVARRRPRPCPQGHGPMVRLAGRAERAALTLAQRAEERLGSVDYDVWACPRCDARAVAAHPAWLSAYTACPHCGARTVATETRTVRAATVAATGVEEAVARCVQCGRREVTRRTLPVVVVTSDGSGGASGWGGVSGAGSAGSGGDSGGGGSSGDFGGSGATAGGGGGSDY